MDDKCKAIKATLKSAIKTAGFTYKELAKELGVSEAGVKKLLNTKDLSLKKLFQICEIVKIPITDIIESTSKGEVHKIELSKEQEEFFKENPDYFDFCFKLIFEETPLTDIKKKHGLTEKSLQIYLRKLEDLKLIERLPSNKIRSLIPRGTRWIAANSVLDQFKMRTSSALVQHLSAARQQRDTLFKMSSFKLRYATFRNLLLDTEELLEKYGQHSAREKRLFNEDLIQVCMINGIAQKSMIDTINNID